MFSKNKRGLFAAIMLGILLCASLLMRNLHIENQNTWVLYDAGKSPAMDFIRQRERMLVADTTLLSDEFKIDYCSGGLMESRGVRHFNAMEANIENGSALENGFFKYHSFIQFMDKRIAVVRGREEALSPLMVDYVILGANADMSIEEVLHSYPAKMIIIDATNGPKNTKRWQQQCAQLNIPCWSVADSGAFILETQ